VFVLCLLACGCSPVSNAPVGSQTASLAVATPARSADANRTPDLRTWDTWFPADIRTLGTGPNCDTRDPQKLAGVLTPPQERAPGVWVTTGCFASPGNTFYDVVVSVTFSDGSLQTTRVLDHSDPNRDSTFALEVHRANVAGMQARIYFNQSAR